MTIQEYDLKVPQRLQQTQEWFAHWITQPLAEGERLDPGTTSGRSVIEEAKQWITPSPTLLPHQRIELYSQQYWWRLLSILQENFPMLTRLFGYREFNEVIAVPYLFDHPPNFWSLVLLGNQLTSWLEQTYRQEDRLLVTKTAEVDWAFNYGAVAPELPPLEAKRVQDETRFQLQPSATLFSLPFDLLNFRKELLKESILYWQENSFPFLEKGNFFYLLFRNHKQNMEWIELTEEEYTLLLPFQQGATLAEGCTQIYSLSKEKQRLVETHLQEWFASWTRQGWLAESIPL